MSSLSKQIGIALVVISGLVASNVCGVEAPYADNFDSYPNGGQPAHFIPSTGDTWIISNPTGSSGRYGSSISSTPGPNGAYSQISLPNVAGRNFMVSTRFTATAFTQGPILDASVGLIALNSGDPSVFPTQGYTLEYNVASGLNREGTLEVRGGNASWKTDDFFRLFDVGQGFTMSLQGKYVDGTLLLTATLGNGIGTITFYGTDPVPPRGPILGIGIASAGLPLRRRN